VTDQRSDDERASASPEARAHSGVDVSQIDVRDVARRAFPASATSEYRVVIALEAHEAIKKHAASDTSVELCGVLAGRLFKDDDGPFLVVQHAIQGVATRRTGARVTFTHETWQHIHKEMEDRFPDEGIVGWYHTHPGFGTFLSEMDQFVQDNFFSAPHSVALVFDPVNDRLGLFMWKDGGSARLRRYWLGDQVRYDLAADEGPPKPTAPPPRRRPPDRTEEGRERDSGARSRGIVPDLVGNGSQPRLSGVWLFAGVVVLFLAFWFGGWVTRGSSQQSREQMKTIEALIRSGIFHEGLDAVLAQVSRRLSRAYLALEEIKTDLAGASSASGADGGPGAASTQPAKAVEGVLTAIQQAHRELAVVSRTYTAADRLAARMQGLSLLPDEIAALKIEGRVRQESMARLCVLQARQLLSDPGTWTPEFRREQAEELRQLAVTLAPHLREEIDRQLPEIAPEPDSGEAAAGRTGDQSE